jgi:hypothetical protein
MRKLLFIFIANILLLIHSCIVAVGFYGNREAEKGLESVMDAADSAINTVKNAQLQVSVWYTYNSHLIEIFSLGCF